MPAVLAVDLDHTLAALLPEALAWHNAELSSSSATAMTEKDVKSSEWLWALQERGFWADDHRVATIEAIDTAKTVLKPLRKTFTLLALTERPRTAEKATREWLDTHFTGIFDKLLFVDAVTHDELVPRRLRLFDEFRVKVVVGADRGALGKALERVPHAVAIGSVPWCRGETPPTPTPTTTPPPAPTSTPTAAIVHVADWTAAKDALDETVRQLNLTSHTHPSSGPKLARYADDLVTISSKKPPMFYANVITSKFTVQRQASIRVQAADMAIATAVHVIELLKLQRAAVVSKISTRYGFKMGTGGQRTRLPKIEIILTKGAPTA